MVDFFIRIELHGASYADYELLHQRMAAAGAVRIINTSNGQMKLPTAEYATTLADDISAVTVRDNVRPIADAVRPGAWVLVVRASEWAIWSQKV